MRQVPADEAIEFLYEISPVPRIGPDTRFGELGLDSLAVIEWIRHLEDQLGVDLDVRGIDFRDFGHHSVAKVLDILHKHVVPA